MKKLVKIGMLLFMGAAFAGVMTSCDDEYPKPGDTPVIVETHNISGMITDRSGEGLEGVEVTLNNGDKATTNAQGYFVFPDVKIGDYTVTATKEGYIEAKTSVKVSNDADGMNAVWNVMMLSVDTKKDYQVSTTAITTLNDAMGTGNIKGNDNGNVEVSIEVPANAFEGTTGNNVTISIMPIYEEEQAIGSRAEDGEIMLVGATISCSDPNVKLAAGKTIALTFDMGAATEMVDARKFDGDKFVKYDNVVVSGESRAKGTVTINADEINNSYGLFAGVKFDKVVNTTSIPFKPSEVNNLDGNKGVTIGSCAYVFGVGTYIDVNRGQSSEIDALLIETLAREYGSNYTTVGAEYPVNITLPIGSFFSISGSQEITTITASCYDQFGVLHQVPAKSYGNVKVNTKITHSADHNGGSSF